MILTREVRQCKHASNGDLIACLAFMSYNNAITERSPSAVCYLPPKPIVFHLCERNPDRTLQQTSKINPLQ